MKTLALAGLAGAAILATLVPGCATTASQPPSVVLAPRTLAEVARSEATLAKVRQRPSVALVLGGGGLRGFAHVGVLRALEEAGLQPDIIVGTSAGAIVGAAYASGMTPAQIEAAAGAVKVSSLVDWTLDSGGLMRGDHIARWVDTLTAGVPIERFPRRFAAVATDLASGRAVLLDSGSAGRAIQASAAVPGVTVPVTYPGGHLVDGGIASLVPVRFARAMGADIVIAVDIYCGTLQGGGLDALSVLRRVMHAQNCQVAAPEMASADVMIAPAVDVPGISAKDEQALVIRAGHEAAREALRRWSSGARID